MRLALLTRNPDQVLSVIQILKHMVQTHPTLGTSLVPYYCQIITPSLNGFLSKGGRSTFDQMDYSRPPLSVEILDMLELFEKHGGKTAYENIKLMVPTYESCCSSL
mmetsp:Transcript_14817/g.20203  ORF Transcript_14817/g.20203 Transcript_14817/m.20203 type:complete len:106 (-) Transcript_14817:189-506(-)